MRLSFAALLTVCASFTAPAFAGEVADVLVLPDGSVFVALEQTPEAFEAESRAGRLAVTLGGWGAAPRRLAPFGAAGFDALFVTETGFVVEGEFAAAEAELREGGVLLRLDGAAPGHAGFDQPAPTGPASTPAPVFTRPADGPVSPGPDRDRPGPPAETAGRRTGAQELPAAPEPPAPGPCDAQAAALADAPWDLDLIVAQADCLAEAGERQNAEGLYERVLAFQPEHFRAALGLARLRQQSGRHGDAARLFETAAGSALTDGEALAARAAARRAREQGGD
ncbi:MAG: tetratricopeptide repeat protein [Oceanicaulis sp.]